MLFHIRLTWLLFLCLTSCKAHNVGTLHKKLRQSARLYLKQPLSVLLVIHLAQLNFIPRALTGAFLDYKRGVYESTTTPC